jgi:Ni/Fe-hydrogenase 1 B-type cytochrome subunit
MERGVYHVLEPSVRQLQYAQKYVWELPIRITHWVNVVCITVLFWTGLYMATPLLSPNGEAYNNFLMGRARELHFICGYLLLISYLVRSYWFWMGNNYARSGFPLFWRKDWWENLAAQGLEYIKLNRGHVHLGHNALAGLSYTIVAIGCGWFLILSGLALYSENNPGGFWNTLVGWMIPLLGGFVIFHVYIVLFDDRLFKNGLTSSIISGFKFYEKEDLDSDRWLT